MEESRVPREQVARFYEQHHSGKRKYDHIFGDAERRETLVRLVGRGGRVLDIGCRSGSLTRYYVEGNDVVGVDVDRDAVRLLRERLGLEAHWLDVDHDPLPFPDASFDVVACTEVLEHLRFPALALAEIRRVLKPDGRLVGSVPNGTRLRNRWRFLTRTLNEDPTHLRMYSPDTLRDDLAAAFQSVDIMPVSGHLLGGGKHGVPIFHWLPSGFRRLMCENLMFVCRGSESSGMAGSA
ncbi:MAG: class I SAM-dependent methyltransferase [Candidatus Eisenbacteria bacterium]